ncbi:tRNA 2-thiouridine synthesizing protein B [Marinobacter sp. es.048]|uniref:sulfurtransferase complex subunit TusB n=1 Tax=Marinobacter sp. es.048 TaxID=1761795 RepID=UPI000B596001|nr:sulfurtransferase complex subunit TusB [Marinobacter sp. es.048]SNC74470.1 tRNA 2-thiouridine synthesizing protein B [Marinobacter sp. es.048]
MTDIQTLHILNKSPEHPRADRCINMMAAGDGLLLTGSGVLLLATGKLPDASKLFALAPDVDARGLAHLSGNASFVDFPEMVTLASEAQQVISW